MLARLDEKPERRPIGAALAPWGTTLVALGLGAAFAMDRAARIDRDQWLWVLVGSSLAAGLGCTGLLLVTRWTVQRRLLLAILPATLPALTGIAVMRPLVRRIPFEFSSVSSHATMAVVGFSEAVTTTALGLLLSAGFFLGIATAAAAIAHEIRAYAAALVATAFGWVAATSAVWHSVVAGTLHELGTTDAALRVGVVTRAAPTVEALHMAGLLGGVALLGAAAALVLRSDSDRRWIGAVLMSAVGVAAFVAVLPVARDSALEDVRGLLHRPWNEPDFEPIELPGYSSEEAPLGVLGPGGLRGPGDTRAEAAAAALASAVEVRERARNPDAELPGEEPVSEEPAPEDGDECEEPAPQPTGVMGVLFGTITPCGESRWEIVTLALDARTDVAELRSAIDRLAGAGLQTLELVGPVERPPEEARSIPLAAAFFDARSWSAIVHLRQACEPEEGLPFFTGEVGAEPLESLVLRGEPESLEEAGRAWQSVRRERPVTFLALTDDATPRSLALTSMSISDLVGGDTYLFPSPEVAPDPPAPAGGDEPPTP